MAIPGRIFHQNNLSCRKQEEKDMVDSVREFHNYSKNSETYLFQNWSINYDIVQIG